MHHNVIHMLVLNRLAFKREFYIGGITNDRKEMFGNRAQFWLVAIYQLQLLGTSVETSLSKTHCIVSISVANQCVYRNPAVKTA